MERLSSRGAFNLSSNLDINTSKKVKKLDEMQLSLYFRELWFITKKILDMIVQKAYRVDFNGSNKKYFSY